jgi:WD40 repeat protein
MTCGSLLRLKERYKAIEPIGAGSFGRTFLAEDAHRLESLCVIKQLLPQPHIQNNAESMAKAINLFKREARQLFHLGHHPQIPSLFAFFEQNRLLYLVQELIDGHDLSQELGKGKHNNSDYEGQSRQLLKELLPVLQFVHEHQVIHRDIKPMNILRRHNGELVLIDFGVAKQLAGNGISQGGSRVGTEGYAPIEQIRGGKAYPASDLYSLGVTCIQLLTQGSLDELYDAMEGRWVWRECLSAKGINITPELGEILDKMLKDGVNERYQSATDVLKDLNKIPAILNRQPVGSAVSPVAKMPVKPTSTIKNQKANSKQQKSKSLPAWRCVQTLIGHTKEVNSIALSPQAYVLVSGSWDHTIKVWNLNTGAVIHNLRGHFGHVSSVAISPDGYILVSGSWDRTIKVWNLGSGKLIHTLKGHNNYVNSVAISPDAQTLVSSSWDKTIKVWQLNTGQLIETLAASDCVRTLAISPNGKLLAGGSDDRLIKLWGLGAGGRPDSANFCTLAGHSNCVRSVAFSPDGQLLASGSWDNTIELWEIHKQPATKPLRTLAGHSSYVYSVAFSQDGKMLASGSRDGTIKLWQMDAGNAAHTLIGHSGPVYSVAFSPDSQTLVSGSDDATIKIWRCE